MSGGGAVGLQVSFAENLTSALPAVISYLHTQDPARDLFAPDHIIVPNAGVRAWLLQNIASQVGASEGGTDGVAANINVGYLGTIDSFLGRGSAQDDPWAVGPLSLSVLSVISRHTGSFTPHIERMGGGLKAARLMADRFDKYHARRPSMIVQWENGVSSLAPEAGADGVVTAPQLSEHDAWQFDLWRLVRAEIQTEPWPVVVENLFAHPEQFAELELPSQLMVVGLQSLGVRHIRALQLLSQRMHIEVVLVHPSPALQNTWAASAQSLPVTTAVAPLQIRQKTIDTSVDPLVGMWLRGAHDAHMLLASQGVNVEVSPAPPARAVEPGNLLHAMQESVRSGVAVPMKNWVPEPSFVVHRAHNLSRQVEILHDELLDAFATIPGLEPHDVVIMCADIEQAAPLLEATFRKTVRSADGTTEIKLPFIVADRGLRHVDDGAALLSQLLTVITGRFSISDIMSVATAELVMQKVGATSDNVSLWQRIIERSQIRWGASAEHRAHLGVAAPVTAYTWLHGIQRSLVGALLPDAAPHSDFGHAVPLSDLDAADIDSISRLSRIVSVLAEFEQQIHERPEQTVMQWANSLESLLVSLAPNDKGQLNDALEALNTMRSYVASAQGTNIDQLNVTFQHFAEQLDEQLSSAPGRQPLRTGAITATSVIPLRSVPFKVVCLLGFDEGTLQAGESEGDDLVSRQEFLGDSNPRIDQRRGILDAVCAASHRFVLTCNGRSIKNNEEVPLITPLAELIDLSVRCGVTELRHKGYSDIEYLHPRHFSSPNNFIEGKIVPGKVWSHDNHVLASLQSSEQATALAHMAKQFESAGVSDDQSGHVVIRPYVLESFLKDPLSAFVRRSLKINTWNDADMEDPATLPLNLFDNQISGLMNDALSAWQSGISLEHWAEISAAVGNFPVGEYGAQHMALVVSQMHKLFSMAEEWGVNLSQVQSYPVSLPFAGGEIAGSVIGYEAEEGRIAMLGLHPKSADTSRADSLRESLALQLLMLRASGYEISEGIVLRWSDSSSQANPGPTFSSQFVKMSPVLTQEVALAKVQTLCSLFMDASQQPFPMFGGAAEAFTEGDLDDARKKFAAYLGKNNKTKEGKAYTYITSYECLVFGLLPVFDHIYEEDNAVSQYFSRFFAAVLHKDDEAAADLDIKRVKPPHGSKKTVWGYVYS